jgi:undecaprenyl-diphosphatase
VSALSPWHAAILGLVEGVTEYLPVSSTGHLILVSELLGMDKSADAKHNIDAFNIVIQGGAILAVLGLYRNRVLQMIRGLLGRDSAGLRLAINIIIAFSPSAVMGVLLKEWIQTALFRTVPVLSALLVGGVAMIFVGRWQRRFFHDADTPNRIDSHAFTDIEHLTWRRALIIGCLQCLALWPGTSRSMVTIVGGMLVGMRPRQAAEFSFILGLPTLGGACVYSAARNFAGDGSNMLHDFGASSLVIGLTVATISAALAVKWLVAFLNRHGLALFGWYRIGLCTVMALLIWRGVIDIAPTQ